MKPETHVSFFGKDDLPGLFQVITEVYERFQKDKASTTDAIVLAVCLHHFFNDWLEQVVPQSEYAIIENYIKTSLKMESEVLRDMTDGFKHVKLSRPPHKQLKEQQLHQGGFSQGFNRGFNKSKIQLTLQNGQNVYFEDVAERIYQYWKTYFAGRV